MFAVEVLYIIISVIDRFLDGALRSCKRCCLLAYIKELTPPALEPIGQMSGNRSDISVGIYCLVKEINHVVP
jgi:hypothetical protein